MVLVDQGAEDLPEEGQSQDSDQHDHGHSPVLFLPQLRLPALDRRQVAVAGQLLPQQIVCGHPEDVAQPQHVFRVRHRGAGLPLADGLAGDGDLRRQVLLAPAPLPAQRLQFFTKGHDLFSSLLEMAPV